MSAKKIPHFARAWILLAITAFTSLVMYLADEALLGKHHFIVTALASKVFLVVVGIVLFDLIDRCFLPWLSIRDVIRAEGIWGSEGEDIIRAAVIRGYFTLMAVVILVVGWGGM